MDTASLLFFAVVPATIPVGAYLWLGTTGLAVGMVATLLIWAFGNGLIS